MKRLGVAGLLLCIVVLISRVLAHPGQNGFALLFIPNSSETYFTGANSDFFVTNVGATAMRTIHLPPAVAGMRFVFALSVAQKIKVNPDNNDLFIATGISPAPTAGHALESDQIVGSLVEIVAVDDANWLVIRKIGTWTNAG